MPHPIIPNKSAPAWVKGEGAVYFVWTTTAPSHGKDDTNVNICRHTAPFKQR